MTSLSQSWTRSVLAASDQLRAVASPGRRGSVGIARGRRVLSKKCPDFGDKSDALRRRSKGRADILRFDKSSSTGSRAGSCGIATSRSLADLMEPHWSGESGGLSTFNRGLPAGPVWSVSRSTGDRRETAGRFHLRPLPTMRRFVDNDRLWNDLHFK
jgi:hypothetical protein